MGRRVGSGRPGRHVGHQGVLLAGGRWPNSLDGALDTGLGGLCHRRCLSLIGLSDPLGVPSLIFEVVHRLGKGKHKKKRLTAD